jgi:hypothetical protein
MMALVGFIRDLLTRVLKMFSQGISLKCFFKRLLFLLITLLLINNCITGQSIKISGRLFDKGDGKIISGGVIFLNPGKQVTSSDHKGEFSFNCTSGEKQISTQVLGYKPVNILFNAISDTVINIYLLVSPFKLNEVTITGDSIKNVFVTPHGSIFLTPAALREMPRLFSEPDLLKSFQLLPGVVSGKDGSADIYVRGGGTGQNIVLANGCYFFLPGHLLGFISPYDLDFLESAELYKDYFPSELGGSASSVISLDFKKPQSDSLRAQVRLGLLSSGISVELPLKTIKWDMTAGLKRGNYSIYAPLLKKIVGSEVGDYLPPDNYSFFDGYLRLSHSSLRFGDISYLFFGNYDGGRNEIRITSHSADTLIRFTDGMSTGWNNMVHALQWNLPVKNKLKWKVNMNYNRLLMGRDIYMHTTKYLNGTNAFESSKVSYSFSPTMNNIGSTVIVSSDNERFSYSAGISNRLRYFSPGTLASEILNDVEVKSEFGDASRVFEAGAFVSSSILVTDKLVLDAGFRLSVGITNNAEFFIPEPRLRLAFDPGGAISPHINYVKLSQFDHSVEGSNAGLRSMLWVPVSGDFGPEISDVFSAGFQGNIAKKFVWTLDGYYKRTSGMVDFKPGASFILDTSLYAMLDRVSGRSYGVETGIIKNKGRLTGSASYTYSRSKREWGSSEGLIWIPSAADRPHNFNLTAKYHFNDKASFGLNWVYTSGAPATIYMHNTSYGEWFETKNNIRYFDYHRLDLSYRRIIYKRKFSVFLDVDIYNAYNRKNTFYLRETYDEDEQRYYYRNVSLFPVMPSLTVTIKF